MKAEEGRTMAEILQDETRMSACYPRNSDNNSSFVSGGNDSVNIKEAEIEISMPSSNSDLST